MRAGGFGFSQQFGFSPLSQPAPVASGPPDPYGPELIVNGNFATDSDWSLTEGEPMTISGGQLHGPGASDEDQAYASQALSAPAATYHVVFTIASITVGSVVFNMNGGTFTGTSRTTPGTFTEDIVCSESITDIRLQLNQGGDAAMDDVSMKKVL